MAVTFANLTTNSSTTDQTTPYTTASITPTANQPVMAAVMFTAAATLTFTPSVSGCGLTWSLVTNPAPGSRGLWLFLGIGASPTSGALTLTADGTTTTTSCLWQITQCTGVDTTTANGVVQSINSKPASTNSVSVNFTNTLGAGSATYGAVGISVQETPSAGTGWTSLGTTSQSAPTSGLIGEGASAGRQAISANWTTASTSFIVGAELASASGVVTDTGALEGDGVGGASITVLLTEVGTLTGAGVGIGAVSSSKITSAVATAAGAGTATVTGATSSGTNSGALLAAGTGTALLSVAGAVANQPTNLQAVTVGSTQVTLTWAAAVGASFYDIERDGVVVASGVTGTVFFDTGLTPGSLHAYRVRSEADTAAVGSAMVGSAMVGVALVG